VARSTTEVEAVDDAEGAVRLYLMWLENPDQLVDGDRISQLEREYGKAKDPLERLRLLGKLDKARQADITQLEADFVAAARPWAARNGVPAAAFRELGVSEEVLAAARIDGVASRGRGRGRGAGSRRREPGAIPGRRAKAVSSDTLRTWMLERSAPFTVAQVTSAVGGSPMTVKKTVDELVAAGRVEHLGPVTDWTGRGRAPNAYQTVGSSNGQS
jgi:hypothetical protein